jgi:DNA (cytosine-5)-methyltransferase 1
MLRTIREIKPGWVVGENVSGIISWDGGLVFEQVQVDLEAEGYEVWPYVLPACGVNAPHRRDRVWFIAHNNKFNGNRTGFCSGKIPQHKATSLRSKSNANDHNPGVKNVQSGQNGVYELGITTDPAFSGFKTKRKLPVPTTQSERIGNMRSGWEWFPTQPPVCSRNDGVPGGLAGITFSKHRNESIKAYGNAIVPQIALQIFKAIEQYENC